MRKRFRLPDGATLFEEVIALAAAQRGPRRMTAGQLERMRQAKREKQRARQRAATERWWAQRGKAKVTPLGERWQDRCVRAMRPGEWYADRDLQILMHAGEDQPVQLVARKEGLIERRRNPDWKGQNRYGEMQQPKWLYRLTEKGEARKELCELLG